MKKLLLQSAVALVALAALMASASASAHDFEVDGIFYNITSDTDNTVEVTYQGEYCDSYFDEHKGKVIIPSAVTHNGITYSVTAIGAEAFYNCAKLTSITLPHSIVKINESAFYGCKSLRTITITNPEAIIEDGAIPSNTEIIRVK